MIKFPRVHIATSVQNRILNMRDELEGQGKSSPPPAMAPPPVVPDPALLGQVLDVKANAPVPEDVPPLEEPGAGGAPDELGGILARGDNLISA